MSTRMRMNDSTQANVYCRHRVPAHRPCMVETRHAVSLLPRPRPAHSYRASSHTLPTHRRNVTMTALWTWLITPPTTDSRARSVRDRLPDRVRQWVRRLLRTRLVRARLQVARNTVQLQGDFAVGATSVSPSSARALFFFGVRALADRSPVRSGRRSGWSAIGSRPGHCRGALLLLVDDRLPEPPGRRRGRCQCARAGRAADEQNASLGSERGIHEWPCTPCRSRRSGFSRSLAPVGLPYVTQGGRFTAATFRS